MPLQSLSRSSRKGFRFEFHAIAFRELGVVDKLENLQEKQLS